MVKRIGDCSGCLDRGIDPNQRPCNVCTRVDEPQTRKDSNGVIIEEPADHYSLKRPFRELMRERIPSMEEQNNRRRRHDRR